MIPTIQKKTMEVLPILHANTHARSVSKNISVHASILYIKTDLTNYCSVTTARKTRSKLPLNPAHHVKLTNHS